MAEKNASADSVGGGERHIKLKPRRLGANVSNASAAPRCDLRSGPLSPALSAKIVRGNYFLRWSTLLANASHGEGAREPSARGFVVSDETCP